MTPFEKAQELTAMQPLPEDVRERLAELEKQADEVIERPKFAWLWESLDVTESFGDSLTSEN